MPTTIVVIEDGTKCPQCGCSNRFGYIKVLNKFELHERINGAECEHCGIVYTNKYLFNKILYSDCSFVDSDGVILDVKSFQEIRKQWKAAPKRKQEELGKLCLKCHKRKCYLNTDYCWECLKYEKEAMYD